MSTTEPVVVLTTSESAPTPSETAQVVSTFVCFVRSRKCRDQQLRADKAFVPDIPWLFLNIQATDPNHDAPLGEAQLRPYVRCGLHSFGPIAGPYNKENRIRGMHSVAETLAPMRRWTEKLELKRLRRERRHLRQELARLNPRPVPAPRAKNYGQERVTISATPKQGKGKSGDKHGKKRE
jgi:hypothetical protein